MSESYKNKINEFNKRWNIVSDSDYKEEFSKFKTRILNSFSNVDQQVGDEAVITFCQILGIPAELTGSGYGPYYRRNIIDSLTIEDNEKRFYYILQVIFYLPFNTYTKTGLFKKLEEAVNLSNINLAVTIKDDEVILYPAGEKIFDRKLVEEVLSFLNNESQKHFIDALRFYEKNNPKDSIKSAESLRRSLEEFLRFKLKNQVGLDGNIRILQDRLKTIKKDQNIRNIIFQIFSYLDNYFNQNSKHQDGDIDAIENEFLIYQTGILIRYVNFALT